MKNKRFRIPRSVASSLWSVADAAIYPAIYMAMVPMLMKGLGVAAFGVWIVLNTLMTTLQLFNLNIGLTAVRKLSAFAAQGDNQKVNLAASAILRITITLIVFVTALGWLITYIIPYWNFLGISESAAGNISACIMLAAFITGLKYLDQVFQGILKAFERFKAAAVLNLTNRIGLLVLTVWLAMSSASVQQLLLANTIFTLLYLLLHLIVIKSSLPFLKISLAEGHVLKRSVLSFSKWPWIQSIIVVLAFQTDRFWVSSFAGLKEVSAYGLAATMFNHIHMIFIAIAAWIFPRISGMVARGDDPENIYRNVRGLLVSVVVLSLVAFNYCAPFLFRHWIGQEMYAGMAPYTKAFIAFELLFAQTIMPFFYLNATGKERVATYMVAGYSICSYVFMAAALFLSHDPVYMIHGMTISLCITMPALNFFVNKYISKRSSWTGAFADIVPVILAVIIIYLPQVWLIMLLIPAMLLLLFHNHLYSLFQQQKWKQPAKL